SDQYISYLPIKKKKKVGPYNNPQETYNYYSLPFCHSPVNAAHKWGGLGEVLGGNELIDSLIDIKFQKPVDKTAICELELDETKVKNSKMLLKIVTGLNSSWVCFMVIPLFIFCMNDGR
ncbi:transmembrane 9 superfamily member 1-like, partial [Olea europaea var. sylvestris]|uniref:transmembrane 9 superfamily member 1-like n=1 Tax=Olea europaea var. sylvestris TaxID=158386 RepID=UPI000C1D022B